MPNSRGCFALTLSHCIRPPRPLAPLTAYVHIEVQVRGKGNGLAESLDDVNARFDGTPLARLRLAQALEICDIMYGTYRGYAIDLMFPLVVEEHLLDQLADDTAELADADTVELAGADKAGFDHMLLRTEENRDRMERIEKLLGGIEDRMKIEEARPRVTAAAMSAPPTRSVDLQDLVTALKTTTLDTSTNAASAGLESLVTNGRKVKNKVERDKVERAAALLAAMELIEIDDMDEFRSLDKSEHARVITMPRISDDAVVADGKDAELVAAGLGEIGEPCGIEGELGGEYAGELHTA